MSLDVWMVFEAVAPDRASLEDALEDHVEMLESENGIEISEKETDEISEMENPHPGLDKGFSSLTEIRAEVEDFARLMELVINYGPTYVQLEGPDSYELGLREGQEALQNVANTMHQYAQKGAGGVLISRASEEN